MKKRILACFMAVCMLVCLSITASAADATYTDLTGYEWAEEAIYRWTEAGIVDGKGNNTFDPAGLLKRSEAAKIFANLLKLTEKSDKVFVDVPGTEWFADYVALVNKAGIMNGMSETTFEPATPVSREMVFTMVCRALGIEGQETLNGTFEDAAQISEWAKKSVNALVNLGYVNGRTATTLAPQENMTRAEMMALLNKVIGVYATEAGVVVKVEGKGVALVVADDVKLEGEFEGTVVVAAEAEVDMAGVTGAAKVVATVGKVSVVNAPVGTTVTAANGATGVTVNNNKVEANDSETVTEPVVTPDPVDPTPDPEEPVEPEQPEEPKPEPEKPSIIVHVHSYKNWTYDAQGKHTGTCECGETKSEPCDGEILEAVEPTCTETGLTAGEQCSVCGYIITAQEEVPALGHDFSAWKPVAGEDKHTRICGECEEAETVACVDENEDNLCDVCVKFYLGVSSKDTTVSATVYNDYSVIVGGLVDGATVDASEVSATVTMQNVDSLNAEYKSHTIAPETGINPTNTVLKNWLGKTYAFDGATVDIDVNGKETYYEFAAIKDGMVVGTTDEDATRAAWQELTSHISTSTQGADNSYVFVECGSFIHLGNKVVYVEEGGLDVQDMNALKNMGSQDNPVRKALTLGTTAETDGAMIYVAAGTQLGVGSSVATLDDDAIITLENVTISGDVLEQLKSSDSTYGLLSTLMKLVDDVVYGVDKAENNAKITITFGKAAELPHCHDFVIVEPTCTEAGSKTCECGFNEVIEALGHEYMEGFDGCINCGQ